MLLLIFIIRRHCTRFKKRTRPLRTVDGLEGEVCRERDGRGRDREREREAERARQEREKKEFAQHKEKATRQKRVDDLPHL